MSHDAQGRHNLAAARRLWAIWRAHGLRDVVIAPGSRSAPLTVAAARLEGLRTHVAVDERAAAFFALGLAKAGGAPAALVCTSGTAAANFAPAVWEASHAHVPLLVVTADRPPELHDAGAAQTMRQQGLYGEAARTSFVLPVPGGGVSLDGFALRAWAAAVQARGPVHVNAPFREPLLPAAPEAEPAEAPVPRAVVAEARLGRSAAQDLEALLAAAARPLVVLGPGAIAPGERHLLAAWLRARRIPAVACVGSGARFGPAAAEVVGHGEAVVRARPPAPPDVVVHFGLLPVSKTLASWLAESGARHVAVGPRHDWVDPLQQAALAVSATPQAFFEAVSPAAHDGRYLAAWHEADAAARARLAALLASPLGDGLPESRLGALLPALVPEGGVLFLSNSMPIREADAFAAPAGRDVRVYVNRGVNGIDGIVSTALGCAAAQDRPLVCVVGDVALQHDLGGLALARASGAKGVVLVVNNAGGAIFEHLPVRKHDDVFEPYFATPQAIDFAAAARAFGLDHACANTVEALAPLVRERGRAPLSLVELRVARDAAGARRARLWAALREEVPA